MGGNRMTREDQTAAKSLGLRPEVYVRLRDGLAAGEHPAWLQHGEPALAGAFPSPIGFELLLDHLRSESIFARRRANLLASMEGKDLGDAEKDVAQATDEGELEDCAIAIQAASPPPDFTPPESEKHLAFLDSLRASVAVAKALRFAFRQHATLTVSANVDKEKESKRFQGLVGLDVAIGSFPAARYLQLRRGEHARALKVQFQLAPAVIQGVFEKSVEGVPPQEVDSYLELFRSYVEQEKMPRFVQEARARLKRSAESLALDHAWSQVEAVLDRGRQQSAVLGLFALRNGGLVFARLDDEGALVGAGRLPSGDAGVENILALFGEERPSLIVLQADSATHAKSPALVSALRKGGKKIRTMLVPVAAARTLAREVARRMEDAHLGHDERQAFMLARLGFYPRAAALHTPHLIRAFVANRAEINPHRLDTLEESFLHALLAARGVDLNSASHDELRLVPGLNARQVELERATGPFRSLADYRSRMGLSDTDWQAACSFLRVRRGDEPLDAFSLHPVYYSALTEALAASDHDLGAVLKNPGLVEALPWEDVLSRRKWHDRIPAYVRRGLMRGSRRPRRGAQGRRLEGLEIGQILQGKITNVIEHGAFVDVGARVDGFIHVSQLSDQFVKDPKEVVSSGQEVSPRVVGLDLEKQRLKLSLCSEDAARDGGARAKGGGRGKGGDKKGRGGRRQEPEKVLPPHVRRMRPKGGSSRGGRSGGDRQGRGGKRDPKVETGKDPQKNRWQEEMDPTNPFVQFFKESDSKKEDRTT